MGNRISEIELVSSGKKIDPGKKYIVGGWGSINPNVKGPKIYSILEKYIKDLQIVRPKNQNKIKVFGM